MKLRVISGSSNPKLSQSIAKHIGCELTNVTTKRFLDGETYVKINESVRGDDVFVVQSICRDVNDNLMELLIMIDALKRASAGRITAVIPYYGYARQDRKAEAREPISAKLVADMITTAGANRLLCVDLHVPQIQGFFNIPVDEVSALPLIGKYLLEKNLKDPVIVAPDAGSAKRARKLAGMLSCSFAIIDKKRSGHNDVSGMTIVGDVDNKTAILVDDMIDTGKTIVKSTEQLSLRAKDVYVCATHPVFSEGCLQHLESSCAKEVIIADTIPVDNIKNDKIKIISMAKLLSEVIVNINSNKSVSTVFNV